MTGPEEGCEGHSGLSAEARALARTVLDRLEPLIERLRTDPGSPPGPGAETCAACPVCAVLAVLRGERPELAVRLAEQTAGIVAVLRAALDEGEPGPGRPGPAPPPPAPSSRPVQRIHVERIHVERGATAR